jgi:hypothetical protein
MFIDETTARPELEAAGIEMGLTADVMAALTDSHLLAVIQEWIEVGDECGAC